MIFRRSFFAGLAMALSMFSGSANAGPITSITISLPANPDATIWVAVSDISGNFSGRVSAPVGYYTVSTACIGAAPCEPTQITALMIDGRPVAASSGGVYRLAIRNPRQNVSISGTVAALPRGARR